MNSAYAFMFVAILGEVSGGAGMYALERLNRLVNDLAHRHVAGVILLNDVARSKLAVDINGASLARAGSDQQRKAIELKMAKRLDGTNESLVGYRALLQDPQSLQELDVVLDAVRAWKDSRQTGSRARSRGCPVCRSSRRADQRRDDAQ